MRTELKNTEIIYNFNTDYDDSDQSYCFILMTESQLFAYQILLNYSVSKVSILVMKPSGNGMSVDHSVQPLSINLSSNEISNPTEVKKAIYELISGYSHTPDELHSYIKINFDEFLKQLLQDAKNRGLIKTANTPNYSSSNSSNSGCFSVVIIGTCLAALTEVMIKHFFQ